MKQRNPFAFALCILINKPKVAPNQPAQLSHQPHDHFLFFKTNTFWNYKRVQKILVFCNLAFSQVWSYLKILALWFSETSQPILFAKLSRAFKAIIADGQSRPFDESKKQVQPSRGINSITVIDCHPLLSGSLITSTLRPKNWRRDILQKTWRHSWDRRHVRP